MVKRKFHITGRWAVMIILGLPLASSLILFLFWRVGKQQKERTTLTIAVLQDTKISDLENNYYKKWLEKKTGCKIEFEFISEGYEKEYLSAMLTTSHNNVDAVFLPEKQELLSEEEFASFISEGYLTNLYDIMTEDSNLASIVKEYGARQEEVFFFPNIDTSRKAQNMQVLWLNIGWLKKLNLQVPRNSEELFSVLQAFQEQDPNGNGIRDELPLISCEEDISLCSYYLGV